MVRNENGEKVANIEEVKRIWRKYFEEELKRDENPMDPTEVPELQSQRGTEDTLRILRSEVRRAIQALPTG